jgi:hypothetical protein
MKTFFRKLARVKKRKAIKKAVAASLAAWALKYGRINQTPDLFINSSQEIHSTNHQKTYTVADDQSLIESKSVNSTRVKTGSGAVIEIQNQHNKIPERRTKLNLTNRKWIKEFISPIRGGSSEDEKLIESILGKVAQSDLDNPSINKILERIAYVVLSVGSNEKLLKILGELEKPIKPSVLTVTPSTEVVRVPDNLQNFQHESRSSSSFFAEGFSNHSKLSPMQNRAQKNRALILAKKKPTLTLKASQVSTSDLFSADSVTGEIQNINIAFNQFKQRMTQIGNQYTGEKQEYFFEQLNQCEIDRFKALSTEKGRITIYGVREAETMLQSEFEGFHEPNSITRPTNEESQEYNVFDGRFRKGMLSGESNSFNEQYTDVDAKLLVSDKTLQDQANERRRLGQKNPNKMSMYEQGKAMGSSIVAQKHKHCNPNKPELPSSPDNVKHIVNALELIPSETEIAKAGVLDDARIAWSKKLNVPESSISDQTAFQGIIILNEDCTIERVN